MTELFNTNINLVRPDRVQSGITGRITSKDFRRTPLVPAWTYEDVVSPVHTRLVDWSAVDAINLGKDSREAFTTHLIGRVEEQPSLLFSTAVSKFCPLNRRAVTANGSVYELVGRPMHDGQASRKFFNWVDTQNILYKDISTSTFEYAISASRSARYEVVLSTSPDETGTRIGQLRIDVHGALCDATYEGLAWSQEPRTLSLKNYPRGVEPLTLLLTRLLKQVPHEERTVDAEATDYMKLSLLTTKWNETATVVETLEAGLNEHHDESWLSFEDLHCQKEKTWLPKGALAPLDRIVKFVPELWPEWWAFEKLHPLNTLPVAPSSDKNCSWWSFPEEGVYERLHRWGRPYAPAATCIREEMVHPHLWWRYFNFFRGAWSPLYEKMFAEEEWHRFLRFHGISS